MPEGQLILVADDDPHIREVVGFALRKSGFAVIEACDGREALKRFDDTAPALIVLDIMMPEMDGTDVCRQVRSRSRVPIIFLSSRDEEVDRIVGLELGGDDYVAKPFSPRELVARVRSVLRRVTEYGQTSPADANVIEHGSLRIDPDKYQAFWNGREVVLTVTEFGLLRSLASYPGKVYSRDDLMNTAYAYDNVVTDRTIDSHIRRIRRKFAEAGGDPIETVHGAGYRLGPCRGR